MARFRVYIKGFDGDGVYLPDYTEITDDVVSLGSISQSLDNSDFDLGVFRNGSCKITVRNDEGRYSQPGSLRTIFNFKRTGALVRITWDYRDHDLCVNFFQAGNEPLGGELEMFKGILEDVPAVASIVNQSVEFTVLGMESVLDKVEIPFADISNGDNISDIIFAALNQTKITELLTVDVGNINVGQDVASDDLERLENKTVLASLKALLPASNSVMYIRDDVIYVTPRTESVDLMYNFYGQASNNGIENIIDIKKYRDGLNRVFNYWTWADTNLLSFDTTSVNKYGIRAKEISLDVIEATSSAKITSLLESNKNEFSEPKVEMELETPINYETYELFLLDKVAVDYPTVYSPFDNNPIPRYGQVVYDGIAKYPYTQSSLIIDATDRFKILSRKIDTTRHTFVFGLRKV